jgi:hypothetical protein
MTKNMFSHLLPLAYERTLNPMSPTTFRILIALFLIAHGLVHAVLAAVPVPEAGKPRTPFFPTWWRSAVDPLLPILRARRQT